MRFEVDLSPLSTFLHLFANLLTDPWLFSSHWQRRRINYALVTLERLHERTFPQSVIIFLVNLICLPSSSVLFSYVFAAGIASMQLPLAAFGRGSESGNFAVATVI